MKIKVLISRLKTWGAHISNSKFLEFFIEVNYLAIIFLIPIWFAAFYSSFNIFELNKIIVFKILLWTLVALTVARTLFFPPEILTSKSGQKIIGSIFKKYFLVPAILIIGLVAILGFSLDWRISFFGSYERQEGITSYFFYFLWSLVLFFNLIAWRNIGDSICSLNSKIRRILITANVSASLVAVYGILQILNIDFLIWPEQPFLTGRALSTLGQPNFFASFLLLTIPLAIYLAHSSKHFWAKTFFAFTVVFQILGLFSTASRGGLLALFVIGFLFVAYLFFASGVKARAKALVIAGVVSIFILGIVILEIFTPGRLHESFNTSTGSFATRVNFFQASADAILKKPAFGYGLENAGEVFIKYYDNDWGVYADVGANTDRAHNLILDTLLNAGFFGLFLFSLWYYSFFKLAWQNYKLNKYKNLALAITAAAGAYLISLMFSFTIVAAEVYFWLFFALLAALHFDQKNSASHFSWLLKKYSLKFFLRLIFLISILGFIFWQIILNARVLIADSYFNDIYIALSRGEPIEAIVLHDDILKLKVNSVQENFVAHFLGDNLGVHLEQASDLANKTIIKKRLSDIVRDLPDRGYQNILLKAKISSELENYEVADKYFAIALNLAPNWPLVYLERGRDFMRRGELAEAEATYKLVDIKLPDVSSVNINDRHRKAAQSYRYMMYTDLGRAYLTQGDYASAAKFFKAAYRNMIEDYSLLKKIADTYYLRGDLDTALRYVAHGSVLSPRDYNWQVALAALYFEKGDKAAALNSIDAAIKLAPDKLELVELKEKYKK
ncbi:MAG TPA: O-antigen ligase family protein [Candidatus Saccharimonadales bacterium]|nr:O-antigen ligase family protein [Candidatus Saccharimonadales bacterium]